MTYNVGNYLLDRLAEQGVTEMFGVPGDFNLRFLDDVVAHKTINWAANANELNGGYAADGYARVKGLGVHLTTYGVGELSAINATAGSYAENVPVIHIVGAPSLSAQSSHLRMHHTLGDGDFRHFIRMATEVSGSVAVLEPATATHDIDRVIRDALLHNKPGYLMLPVDVAVAEVTPPSAPLEVARQVSSEATKQNFREAATAFLAGKKTAVLADIMTSRLNATEALGKLVDETGFPYSTLMWGKALLDESNPQFAGIYIGALSDPTAKHIIEGAEALIFSGVELTDTTTAGFSHKFDPARVIDLKPEFARIGNRTFAPLSLADSLEILREAALEAGAIPMDFEHALEVEPVASDPDAPLTQEVLWSTVSAHLDSNNTVVTEMGTSFFGMARRKFPKDSRFIGMPLWGSIGYSLPALLGASLADKDARGVLFIGDGSAQLTIQELGTFFRRGLAPVIFLINNDGYTIERSIHGMEAVYNDIATYNWQLIPTAFGASEENTVILHAKTTAELVSACETAREVTDKLVFIEVVTEREDMPQLLRDFGVQAAAANRSE